MKLWRHNLGRMAATTTTITTLAVTLAGGLVARAAEPTPADTEFFESHIRPVLAQECYECHRTGAKTKGGLTLDTRYGLLKGGDSGPALRPGDPAGSLLLQALRHDRADLEMPKARAKLDAAVIADFATWIRAGAPDPRTAPPTAEQMAADTDWSAVLARRQRWWSFQPLRPINLADYPAAPGREHSVDRLLAPRLAAAHLETAPRADRRTLIRRLSYNLRGLPPTPAEIAAFENDPRPHAFDALVDTYLKSPQFGECWARHWMDWVRYADSHGSEGDPMIPHAWRYRDYLIRALNADVPYDQLVREHLAGDLLPHPRVNAELGLNESALGLGHLRMVFHGFAPTDVLDEQVRFTDDQIGTVTKAFLGLTVACARCHDHKFDPVSQRDYYALFGIFATCPPAAIAVDAPNAADARIDSALRAAKPSLQKALAAAWTVDVRRVSARLAEPDANLRQAIAEARDPESLLHPFYLLTQTNAPAALPAWWPGAGKPASPDAPAIRHWDLTTPAGYADWRHDGAAVAETRAAGEFAVAPEGDRILTGIYPAGVYSHLLSTKDRGVLLSPHFQLDGRYDLWLRIAGDGGPVARYAVQNYPRDGTVFPVNRVNGGQWHWMKFGLDYWQGDRVHVEVTTAADQSVLGDPNATRSWFGLSQVVVTPAGAPAPTTGWPFAAALATPGAPTNATTLAARFGPAAERALAAWAAGHATDSQALLLDGLLRLGLLRNRTNDLPGLTEPLAAYRAAEAARRIPTRAQGVIETEVIDQPLFTRGNHKQPEAPVRRRFLEVIDRTPYPAQNSGRRELAEDFLRADNPLLDRVIVNRVWHHLFGRGLVGTPDNFGRLGEEPTHPELLDYLAGWFRANGRSLQALVRFLVTTEAWQRSSDAPPGAVERDPNNLLLSHFRVRRLEAEAIRDALLAVSGELRDQPFGPPISGTDPRRSIYVRVKRNELDPFLSSFDAPAPASTTGKRDVTNVPGQSLTLLNSPFVLALAEHWAGRAGTNRAPDASRVAAMFEQALGRRPEANELARLQAYVAASREQRAQITADRERLLGEQTALAGSAELIRENVTERLLAGRSNAAPAAPIPLAPLSEWDFTRGLLDQAGQAVQTFGQARVENGALLLDGRGSYVATPPLTRPLRAKTLAVAVQLSDLQQQGGGVMTVQDAGGNIFDAIVYGEREPGRWMAGSEFFQRYQSFGGAAETGAREHPVHLALVYAEDGTITAYRNGEPYGQPVPGQAPVTFAAGEARVLFGNRHGEPGGNKHLAGRIFHARLYDRALTANEVAALARADAGSITEADLRAAYTDSERRAEAVTRERLAVIAARLQNLGAAGGFSSEWADLGHALFNLKEFIFLR